jgi:hypothetical protein
MFLFKRKKKDDVTVDLEAPAAHRQGSGGRSTS